MPATTTTTTTTKTTTTTTIIDYKAYPHLFDAILDAAPLGALVQLRATCRAVRARIDAVLFAHVELHTFPGPNGGPRVLVMTPPAASTIPMSCSFPRLPFSPPAVRALDVAVRDGLAISETAGFTSLHTLRPLNRRSGAAQFRPHTVVQRVSTSDLSMGVQLPPGARRLVLHIQYDAVPQWRRAGVTVDGDVRDFVFVFWPEKPHASERVPTASWLFHCFYNVLPMGQEFSVTVVGLERVLAPAVNAADVPAAWFEASRPQIRAHCLDRYPRLRQSKAGLAWVDAVFARTRFVEIDEWTTELGERQHIEGRWSEPRRGPMDVRREEQEARAAAHHVEEMW